MTLKIPLHRVVTLLLLLSGSGGAAAADSTPGSGSPTPPPVAPHPQLAPPAPPSKIDPGTTRSTLPMAFPKIVPTARPT